MNCAVASYPRTDGTDGKAASSCPILLRRLGSIYWSATTLPKTMRLRMAAIFKFIRSLFSRLLDYIMNHGRNIGDE